MDCLTLKISPTLAGASCAFFSMMDSHGGSAPVVTDIDVGSGALLSRFRTNLRSAGASKQWQGGDAQHYREAVNPLGRRKDRWSGNELSALALLMPCRAIRSAQ